MEKISSVVCGFLSAQGVSIRTLPYPPPPLMRFVTPDPPKLRYAPGQNFTLPLERDRTIRTFLRVDHDIYVEEGA